MIFMSMGGVGIGFGTGDRSLDSCCSSTAIGNCSSPPLLEPLESCSIVASGDSGISSCFIDMTIFELGRNLGMRLNSAKCCDVGRYQSASPVLEYDSDMSLK